MKHCVIHQSVIKAIQDHPEIVQAAITGSQAGGGQVDRYSDLDALLLARDLAAVRNVRGWFPHPETILICQFHLSIYCTVLLDDFQKFDLAIVPTDDRPSGWVVHNFKVIKGDDAFKANLAIAAAATQNNGAAHLNPDINLDNVLLLLVTARHRANRGEKLSAHTFLSMASDMMISLEKAWQDTQIPPDLLDPRRRLEKGSPRLAGVLQECLFTSPDQGIRRLAEYLTESHREPMTRGQIKTVEHLLEPTT